jgi:hypothetical protein
MSAGPPIAAGSISTASCRPSSRSHLEALHSVAICAGSLTRRLRIERDVLSHPPCGPSEGPESGHGPTDLATFRQLIPQP